MSTLKPKCLYANKDLGYSSTGHITPCCWLNLSYDEPWIKDLFADELHIDNVNSVEEVLTSDQWLNFYEILRYFPEKAPPKCFRHCAVDLDVDIEGKRTFK